MRTGNSEPNSEVFGRWIGIKVKEFWDDKFKSLEVSTLDSEDF